MDGGLGIIKDVVIGLITGVAASGTYEKLTAIRKRRELRNTFGNLQGEYTEWLRKRGAGIVPTGGTIRLKYCGGRKFTTSAINGEGKEEWTGEISIGEGSEVLGSGYYQYNTRDDNGIHRVVYISSRSQFDVSGENTSHPDGVKDFKTIWRLKR